MKVEIVEVPAVASESVAVHNLALIVKHLLLAASRVVCLQTISVIQS